MFHLEFNSKELQFPYPPQHIEAASKILKEFKEIGLIDHFLLFSSGTTSSDLKGYALGREALLTNAETVNNHLGLTARDIWGLSIPWFHVGGLSVLARAHVLGSKMIDLGFWEAKEWVNKLAHHMVTITTVVPTQIFDLVNLQLKAPTSLKFLVVGGDFLSEELEKRALQLGWPIVRTFGMTEVCSQLACSRSPKAALEILPIHQVKTNEEGRLFVKSNALFTLQFKLKDRLEIEYSKNLCDNEGFYQTQDRVEIRENTIKHLGRFDDQIKVSGKLVDFNLLKEKFSKFALDKNIFGKIELLIENDERSGKKLVVLYLPDVTDIEEIKDLFSPIKTELREVICFNRSDLGKLKRDQD